MTTATSSKLPYPDRRIASCTSYGAGVRVPQELLDRLPPAATSTGRFWIDRWTHSTWWCSHPTIECSENITNSPSTAFASETRTSTTLPTSDPIAKMNARS